MKLSQLIKVLDGASGVKFKLDNGEIIPAHVHVTEVGMINKHFVDCGGTVRRESKIGMQLWHDNDTEHRLSADKFLSIIKIANQMLALEDFEIEVEYQSSTIGKFGLEFSEGFLILTSTLTDCLAKDKCGIDGKEIKAIEENNFSNQASYCDPNGVCC